MLYLIKSGKYLKIGYTSNIENRIKQYKTHNPDIVVLSIIEGTKNDERKLHNLCKQWQYDSEWFYNNPNVVKIFTDNNPANNIVIREPYVKVYTSFLPKLYKFKKKSLYDVLFKLIELSEENTMQITCNKSIYEKIAIDLNKSVKTIKSCINHLIDDELIIKLDVEYIINPKYFWKGNDISRSLLLSKLETELKVTFETKYSDDLESDEF